MSLKRSCSQQPISPVRRNRKAGILARDFRTGDFFCTDMYQKTKIDLAIKDLIAACGFDKSEGASEDFYFMLLGALKGIQSEIEEAHSTGMRIDMGAELSAEIEHCLRYRASKN